MGMFNQLKMAQKVLEGMSPEQIEKLMSQVQNSQAMVEGAVRQVLDEEIAKRKLVTQDEVRAMIAEARMSSLP